ncbi:N amino acid transport system protein [Erysiphe neolycopersici]|uniref:N amino acid transport system protein n=1 Tax=Erysiphe neolycopersici TaxID=212602 RepID=A0A420HIX0_9PEZI|nr:N amino acid transport system protein [Erysiphe neolycopersici]
MAHYQDSRTSSKEKVPSLSDLGPFGGKAEIGEVMDVSDMKNRDPENADERFNRLGWKRLTVVLIVEAIALGSLSLPSAFATLGLASGVIICILVGVVAIYTSYVVGQVKIAYPHVSHYADAGRLLAGKFGYELVGVMFVLQLLSVTGSHSLTGAIAFGNLSDHKACSVAFSAISAIILFFVAIPPSFSELAILGYIDFVSIILAIAITMVGTGITWAKSGNAATAIATSTPWSYWPREGLTFVEAFVAVGNIIFAYCFAVCQFSFMDEMHTPKDFPKSIYALGIIEMVIYTVTGSTILIFVGSDVQSPALLSAGPTLSKVAFGVALPVIFISGSINTTVVARYIHGRMYANSPNRHINTKQGWITWIITVSIIILTGWLIAESIPFFDDLLSITSSLLISGFTFYFPAWMWFKLVRKGSCFSGKNILLTIINTIVLIIGLIVFFGGTYASIQDILNKYAEGHIGKPFSCKA